eukprot:403367959
MPNLGIKQGKLPLKPMSNPTEYKSLIKSIYSKAFNGNEVLKAKWEEGSLYTVPTYQYIKDNEDKTEIKVMTYNVWFDDHFRDERYQVIINMIEQSDADFICLQEVTQAFMSSLLQNTTIRSTYFISGNHISGYGVLILSKYPSLFYEMPFCTLQGRSLLICEPLEGITQNQKNLLVGTMHLESNGPNFNIRIKQMQSAFEVMRDIGCLDHLFMGDFNFDSTSEDQHKVLIENGYYDVYLDLNDGKESGTMLGKKDLPQWRPDKIICLKDMPIWKPKDIQIVGKFAIPKFANEDINNVKDDGIIRTPSDHMALLATFELNI